MRMILRCASIILPLMSAGCSGIGVFTANLPTHFDDITVSQNIPFGAEPWQKLDIYSPPHGAEKPYDVVVFYYGGRWETGSKNDYRFVGSTLAKRGYIVVIADYRKYPDVRFPVFVKDAAKSLSWVSDHIASYNGNPHRIHLTGHSAGAHIAALLAVDARYLQAEGKDRSKLIHDFAGLAGPYSFTPDEKDLIDMFRPPENYPQMQATTFIDGKQPPMLLLWGDKDQFVGKINMDKMVDAIHKKGGVVKAKIYPDIDHIWLIASLSWLGKAESPVTNDLVKFFNSKN